LNSTFRSTPPASPLAACRLRSGWASLDQDVKEFHAALSNLTFGSGQQYSEFRPGAKVAEYGLAALVVGGAAAVAVESGAGFFKVIGVGVLALVSLEPESLIDLLCSQQWP
jgi:uncharacterized membrane-anchored protein